jgi:hypothetical protein
MRDVAAADDPARDPVGQEEACLRVKTQKLRAHLRAWLARQAEQQLCLAPLGKRRPSPARARCKAGTEAAPGKRVGRCICVCVC